MTVIFLSFFSPYLTIVIVFNYQYSFKENVTVFIITFPALWLFIPFICYNEWMNDGVSVGYKGGIYAVGI